VQLGRVAGNALILDDDTVSRSHAELCRSERQVSVRDPGSTNGTFVNGARLPSFLIQSSRWKRKKASICSMAL
jgi:pSer/pThr/pTyr-binding forkhead associated (FHA) protein